MIIVFAKTATTHRVEPWTQWSWPGDDGSDDFPLVRTNPWRGADDL